MTAFTFIDLFCGCGGFSLGMERAGFTNLAAIMENVLGIRSALGGEFFRRVQQEARAPALHRHTSRSAGLFRQPVPLSIASLDNFETLAQRPGGRRTGSRSGAGIQ